MQSHMHRQWKFHTNTTTTTILIALIVWQIFDECLCHQQQSHHSATTSWSAMQPRTALDKRTIVSGSGSGAVAVGQPEEIFSVADQMESNYDEYPMVVPKRAALLLDRIMVALHHALEKEQRKISDFYDTRSAAFKDKNKSTNNNNNNNNESSAKTSAANSNEPNNYSERDMTAAANSMYSDDDPSVVMDYDFKDLNAINRATGETLMGKSFQRRANTNSNSNNNNNINNNNHNKQTMGLNFGNDMETAAGNGIAFLTPMPVAGTSAGFNDDANGVGGGGVVGVRNNVGAGGGRMYWRCYFNAVSCF